MFAQARKLEIEEKYESAAMLYADLFDNRLLSKREIVEFALFCWQMTDYGFSAGNNISVEILAMLGDKLSECLKMISDYDNKDTESHFWLKYIQWADYGEALTIEECMKWLKENPSVKEPALYIYMCSEGKSCKEEAGFLKKKYSNEDTLKSKYISSVIK